MPVNLVQKNQNFVSAMIQDSEKLINLWSSLKDIDDQYTEEDFGNVLQQSDLDEPTRGNELDHLLVADVASFITAIRAINSAIETQDINLYKLIR